MDMLPWFSSMQRRKFCTSVAQAGFSQELLVALPAQRALSMAWGAAGGAAASAASAGALEPPPLKNPPMAWPMEDPTATPLFFGRLMML
ncbi:uncharacterized protein BO72DRAFT_126404 [Aspergillus fijiensis CBS 313.89]|uniref:Uncharacterized protein n=1 Tax=Aspergillus fijiensis CBS 313.89 TaxID=1448319 RepID=A0A8G1RRP9_9EURO|nr:uncharacterized protein BO72DRAFT_126404 [Aspergillus fijiensis CBS 313.89]RAK76690.1 hypothetical protein BO72DRAFT_126404 [Aspergillus fijiensis CBS 313.89]